MPNPHLDDTGTPWTMSTPTTTNVSTSAWSPAAGRDESGYLSTSPHYDPGHDSDAGQYADEVTGNDINTVTGTQVTADTTPTVTNPTEFDDEIWDLAVQAADPTTNPGYALSADYCNWSNLHG